MSQIGVFWFYKGTVIGKPVDLDIAEDTGIGVLDSPDTHTDLWDNDRGLLKSFPDLYGREYFSIPRGRVLWEIEMSSAKVFMDSVLFENTIKQKVLKFFNLKSTNVKWERDVHYTTNSMDIDALFEECDTD